MARLEKWLKRYFELIATEVPPASTPVGEVPAPEPECDVCGLAPSQHDPIEHWCHNQSFTYRETSDGRLFDLTLECEGRAVEFTFTRPQIDALVARLREFDLIPSVRSQVLAELAQRKSGEPVLCTWAGCRTVWKHALAASPAPAASKGAEAVWDGICGTCDGRGCPTCKPEPYPDERAAPSEPEAQKAVAPTWHKDCITLTALQLRHALDFAAPDFDTDEDQRETEVSIAWAPEGATHTDEGDPDPAGYKVWLTDYPEEGSIPLDESPAGFPVKSAERGRAISARRPSPSPAESMEVQGLTAVEREFLIAVFLAPGCKLSDVLTTDHAPAWKRFEADGTVACVGSWKWTTPDTRKLYELLGEGRG